VLCINMAHISPWEATLGLVAGAQRLLAKGVPLILYGPWRREGVDTAPSNEAFDASLKTRDPRWGLRRVKDLDAAAAARAFARTRLVEMPANNLMLVYRRRPAPPIRLRSSRGWMSPRPPPRRPLPATYLRANPERHREKQCPRESEGQSLSVVARRSSKVDLGAKHADALRCAPRALHRYPLLWKLGGVACIAQLAGGTALALHRDLG
jgi:hypothetical protein